MAGRRVLLPFISALLFSAAALAAEPSAAPAIGIIIDDVGYRYREDLAALQLPGPVAFAILPHSPHAEEMSARAALSGKEVLLHLPMEADREAQNRFLGPGGLMLDMSREQFAAALRLNLASVPDAIGVNNHMGSLLTRHAGRMQWLMEQLRADGKFYVDSVTSSLSVAGEVAQRMHVPSLSRDVFLDNEQDTPNIRAQFDELVATARRKGAALAIGHPHPETIAVLREKLAQLDSYGVRLVGVRQLLLATEPPARPMPAAWRR